MPKTLFLNPDDEHREWLIAALSSALRWYTLLPDKRKGDDQDAVILIDLMQELHAAIIKKT